jgi:hypothetical protein
MSYPPNQPDVAPAQANHGGEVSQIEPDDIGVGLLTVLLAFVAVVVLLVVVLLQAWFYNWKVEVVAQRPPVDVQKAPAAAKPKHPTDIDAYYGWVDPETKKARAIPISRAMELVAKELAAAPGKESGGK